MHELPLPCLADYEPTLPHPKEAGWLAIEKAPLEALFDDESEKLSTCLPEVIDAHVHLFPDPVFEALWRWFEKHAWPIRYKLYTKQVAEFLFSRGVSRIIALHYAHRPGMSQMLNHYIASVCQDEPRIWGLGTVLPGEEGAKETVNEAFSLGLRGLKLHCHVQCFAVDDERMHDIYEACVRAQKPLLIHAGREPKSPAYKCDPHALCNADRIRRVLDDYPGLKLSVPHLGADEFDAYGQLLEQYDNLWLDTTMAMAELFQGSLPSRLLHIKPERILYGTDFPNIPYAWDREIKKLEKLVPKEENLEMLLSKNARSLFEEPLQH